MIEDDFDKLVRDMFERFFGGAFRMVPGENGIRFGIAPEEVAPAAEVTGRDLIIDEIDLGEEYLVIVESPVSVDEPVAFAKGNMLKIKVSPVVSRGIEIEVPFTIDVDQSTVSHNNGVIEVRLVKTSNTGTELNEGLLRII